MSYASSSLAMRVLKMALAVVLVVGLCPSVAYATSDGGGKSSKAADATQAAADESAGTAETAIEGSSNDSEAAGNDGSAEDTATADSGSVNAVGENTDGVLVEDSEEDAADEGAEEQSEEQIGLNDDASLSLMTSSSGYVWPLPIKGTISKYYGSGGHGGVDISASAGTTVRAARAGRVKYVQKWDGYTTDEDSMQSYGNLVVVYHPDKGTATYYAHLKSISVSLGQTVSIGQQLGTVGTTGNSTGNHLHFELRLNAKSANNTCGSGDGTRTNPLNYVSQNDLEVTTHTHSWSLSSTDKNQDGSDTQHKLTYKCSCGSTKTELKDHSWVWSGVTRKCSVCGQEYTYHENTGEYLTSQKATLFKGDKSSTGSYVDISSGKKLKITEIKKNSANHWMGKTTYGGYTGWVYLHNAKYNGNAGKHTFKNGKCTACGCVQAASSPGVYKAKSTTTLYKDNVGSSTTKSVKAGDQVTITRVGVTTYNYYWGYTSDGYLVSMDALELEPVSSVGGTPVEVREGNYYIKLAKNTSYQMDIYNGSKDNKAKLTIYPVNNSGAQQFKLTRNSNGSYTIVNINSGKCIDAYNNGKTNGTALIQYTVGSGKANQQWYIERNSDGTYSFRGVDSNLYMHITGGKVSNSNPVCLWEGSSSTNAHWVLVRMDGTSVVPTQAMYRLYNPNSGEHFYTASAEERDYLDGIGWNYEGIGWTAPLSSNTPVYRMYNPNVSPTTGSGEHHYTTSAAERDMLVGAGWSYEGVGWYSDDAKSVPLYRVYNPNEYNNNHHYTTSTDERDYLLSIGWNDEGIAWYGVK